jgi:hypothetical protein
MNPPAGSRPPHAFSESLQKAKIGCPLYYLHYWRESERERERERDRERERERERERRG